MTQQFRYIEVNSSSFQVHFNVNDLTLHSASEGHRLDKRNQSTLALASAEVRILHPPLAVKRDIPYSLLIKQLPMKAITRTE